MAGAIGYTIWYTNGPVFTCVKLHQQKLWKEEQVERQGIALTNFIMVKDPEAGTA